MQTIIESQMTRRAVLRRALAASFVASTSRVVNAQQLQTHLPTGVTPKPKGSSVFLDYDQQELDAAYDQTLWAPNQAEITKRNLQKNEAAIARLGRPARLAYGPTDIEKLDLYPTKRRKAPINVFIHGGAWRTGDASYLAWQSEMFFDAGAHFIALDFNNALETNGNLMTLAEQVRRAVAWVYQNAARFDGDPDQIYVAGHSSGAHLAAVMLTTDWRRDFGLPVNMLKGGLCASGLYDLYPVSLSARSKYIKFDAALIEALSPQRHLSALNAPVIVAHGTLETPEFQRQNREFAAAVKAVGKTAEFIVLNGYNHFEVQESLGNPYGLLGRQVLRQMKLSPTPSA